MAIIGITGKIGSGKSLKQLAHSLDLVEQRQKVLVTNFALDLAELLMYARMKKYGWLAHIIQKGQVAIISSADSLGDLLCIPNSIVCLDEAGIFLNAYGEVSKKLLYDLCQSRKFGADLIWAAQFQEQVHWQYRMLTQYYIHCEGLSLYDRKMKRPRLWFKTYYHFETGSYINWCNDRRSASSYFRTRFLYAFKTQHGFLNKYDRQLFKCFDSFSRLDNVTSRFSDGLCCPLPKDYYFQRIASEQYDPTKDPFTKFFKPIQYDPLPQIVSTNWVEVFKGIEVYKPKPKPQLTDPEVIKQEDFKPTKNQLIQQAIFICKSKGIQGPIFKSMTLEQIQEWIDYYGSNMYIPTSLNGSRGSSY